MAYWLLKSEPDTWSYEDQKKKGAKGDAWTTLELKLNLVRPISKDTGTVRAEGRIIHRGRTVATSEGTLKDKVGKLYAHATTTCMVFPAKT